VSLLFDPPASACSPRRTPVLDDRQLGRPAGSVGVRLAVLERRFDDHIGASTLAHTDSLGLHRENVKLMEKLDERQDGLDDRQNATDIKFGRLYGAATSISAITALLVLYQVLRGLGVLH
jgi:hypothetical protein